ncbi:hypothetical protein NPIL_485201, partial [Nephila pilipes]
MDLYVEFCVLNVEQYFASGFGMTLTIGMCR